MYLDITDDEYYDISTVVLVLAFVHVCTLVVVLELHVEV